MRTEDQKGLYMALTILDQENNKLNQMIYTMYNKTDENDEFGYLKDKIMKISEDIVAIQRLIPKE